MTKTSEAWTSIICLRSSLSCMFSPVLYWAASVPAHRLSWESGWVVVIFQLVMV